MYGLWGCYTFQRSQCLGYEKKRIRMNAVTAPIINIITMLRKHCFNKILQPPLVELSVTDIGHHDFLKKKGSVKAVQYSLNLSRDRIILILTGYKVRNSTRSWKEKKGYELASKGYIEFCFQDERSLSSNIQKDSVSFCKIIS
eukprot:g34264.t1